MVSSALINQPTFKSTDESLSKMENVLIILIFFNSAKKHKLTFYTFTITRNSFYNYEEIVVDGAPEHTCNFHRQPSFYMIEKAINMLDNNYVNIGQ